MEGYKNQMSVCLDGKSENEGLARMVAASFLVQFNPTMEEMDDVKTAISEAVTNAIIHGYDGKEGRVELEFFRMDNQLTVTVKDEGIGIPDVEAALAPMFTTKPEMERSGMGFTFMEAFMDQVEVESEVGKGTRIRMTKRFDTMLNQV